MSLQFPARVAVLASVLAVSACGEEKRPTYEALVVGDAPTHGAEAAWVTIIEFADFQCPACGTAAPTVRDLLEYYRADDSAAKGDVRLAFKHLPLTGLHEHAYAAAVAAECAHAQGLFWPMHDELFAHQTQLDSASLATWASAAGVDVPTWQACIDSAAPRQRVDADRDAADDVGIGATPSFIINGALLEGAGTLGQFIDVVDDCMAAAKASGVPVEEFYEKVVLGR